MREANSAGGGFGLGGVVGYTGSDGLTAVVGAFIVGDFLAVFQNALAELDILVVKV